MRYLSSFVLLLTVTLLISGCGADASGSTATDDTPRDTISTTEKEQQPEPNLPLDTLHPNAYRIADGELPSLMDGRSRLFPMVSAHRGGRNIEGYPENSLEVFDYVLDRTPAMMEMDVNITSDGVLILMHDNSLDRTTTGSGRVQDTPYSDIRQLRLKDDFGSVTDFEVPTFAQALDWSKGKSILSVDVKRGVPFQQVVELIEKKEMEDRVVVITYNTEDAELVHRLNPDLMISVSIRSLQEWEMMASSTVPYDRMVAFTGTRLSPKALFDTLAAQNIPAILGTLGNLDERARSRGDQPYTEWLALGADIFATDRPLAVGQVIR